MEFTTSNLINIGAYLITLGIFVGTIKTQFGNLQNQLSSQREHLTMQISNLEKEKVEKHNQVIDRTYKLEQEVCILKEVQHRGEYL